MKRSAKLTIALVASVVLLAAMVSFVGFGKTIDAAREAGLPAVLSAGGLSVAWLVLQAAAWMALNRTVGHRVKFRSLLAASTVGLAGNMLTPSTYLGGEPGKVLYIGRRTGLPYEQLVGTVLLLKYVEAMSFLLFVAAGSALAVSGMGNVLFSGSGLWLGAAVLAVAVAALVATAVLAVSLARRWRPLTALVGLLARVGIFRRFFTRLRVRCRRVEDQASGVFARERSMVVPAFGMLMLTHVTIYLKPLLFFWLGWGKVLSPAELGLIFLASQVLLAFQLTPSGVGTLDGGLLGVLYVSGIAITQPQCAAYLLCLRLWDGVAIAAGAALAARVGVGLFSEPKAPPT
jgi:uncharacterized protein (TIRG00374 family)